MRALACAVAMILTGFQAESARSQTLPRLRGGSVRAQVVAASTGYFKYEYRLAEQPSETLSIVEFTVDAEQATGRMLTPRDGLPPEARMVLTTRGEREEIGDNAVAS